MEQRLRNKKLYEHFTNTCPPEAETTSARNVYEHVSKTFLSTLRLRRKNVYENMKDMLTIVFKLATAMLVCGPL